MGNAVNCVLTSWMRIFVIVKNGAAAARCSQQISGDGVDCFHDCVIFILVFSLNRWVIVNKIGRLRTVSEQFVLNKL